MQRTASAVLIVLLSACGNASEGSGGSTGGSEEARPDETPTEGGGEGTTEASTGELVVGTDVCTTDADCVPAGCCHPASCVAAANAPSCTDVMCTAECRIGTLDCGGSCLCHEGHCAARLSQPPAGIDDLPPPS